MTFSHQLSSRSAEDSEIKTRSKKNRRGDSEFTDKGECEDLRSELSDNLAKRVKFTGIIYIHIKNKVIYNQ